MSYKPDKIRQEFIPKIKKAKNKEDVHKIVYKFILERVGKDRKAGQKELDSIKKLEKAIPEDKIHLLEDFLKYRRVIEMDYSMSLFIRTVDWLIDYGNIITTILSELYRNYKMEYEKTDQDIDA